MEESNKNREEENDSKKPDGSQEGFARTCHHMLEILTEEIPQIHAKTLQRRCAIAATIHAIHRNLPFIH